MSNQILRDILNTTAPFLDTGFEMPLEQEILLADYDLPVFKIIRSTAQHTITGKYINGSRLIIEGFFRTEIYYQSSAPSRLTSVSKKIPFQKQFELSEGVQRPYFITIDGECQYINTRAVNSTRIESRGVYRFTVRGYARLRQQTATAVDSTTACTENEEVDYFSLCGRGIRRFSVEDEISFGGAPDRILHISAHPGKISTRLYRDKVNVKSEIEAEILYTVEDSTEIHRMVKTFPCNQMADVPGTDESCVAYADLSVMGITVTGDADNRKIRCMVTAQRDVKVFRKQNMMAVTDVFSRRYRYTSQTQPVVCDANVVAVSRNAAVTVEDMIGSGYEVVHCFAQATSPVITTDNDVTVLKSKILFSAIVKNSREEYECFTKTESIVINTGDAISEDNEYFITVQAGECTAQMTSDVLKVKADLLITGFVICRRTVDTVSLFEENTEKTADTVTDRLVLYYGRKGEKLFDIAKTYKTDVQLIMDENAIESKILGDDRMLFIPSFGQ
ncbi:MAG: DUF3794 domain-containing protein [Oscillospiraceae bacterium]|nr:DUF3794 domain-containing protein [Oscillospiraceae bacterium]